MITDEQIDEKLRAFTKSPEWRASNVGFVTKSYRAGYRQALRDLEDRMKYNDAMSDYAHKLAMDLECVLLSPSSWTERAFETLDEYKKAKDKLYQEMIGGTGT